MKTQNLIFLLLFGLFCNQTHAQITLSYRTESGELVQLDSVSYYDIESKPIHFNVSINSENPESFIFRVEIYRLISSTEDSEVRAHFYKSVDYSAKELSRGVSLEDMFTSSPHSLIVHGFEIKFCRLRKYNANAHCHSSNNYKILYEE